MSRNSRRSRRSRRSSGYHCTSSGRSCGSRSRSRARIHKRNTYLWVRRRACRSCKVRLGSMSKYGVRGNVMTIRSKISKSIRTVSLTTAKELLGLVTTMRRRATRMGGTATSSPIYLLPSIQIRSTLYTIMDTLNGLNNICRQRWVPEVLP